MNVSRAQLAFLALLAAACSAHPAESTGGEVDAVFDAASDAFFAEIAADSVDAAPTDVRSDVAETTAEVADGDAVDAADVPANCPGASWCPCQKDGECDTGKCLETPGGHVCAATCVEPGCPGGYVCSQIGATDPVSYCVYSHLSLCSPCVSNKDCAVLGQTGATCLDYGDSGHFCGGVCAKDSDCGDGYTCTSGQCRASSGICSCSDWAITAAISTTCLSGKCSGVRSCSASGLSACSAATPSAEVCNGLDDDCNGLSDDLPSDATCAVQGFSGGSGAACSLPKDCTVSGESCDFISKTCKFLLGSCPGKPVCVNGGQVCQSAKIPKAELCNGEDDNCDGSTDEGFSAGGIGIGGTCGVGGCSGGVVVCGDFASAKCSSDGKKSSEICNGIDDNCDGSTDEGLCEDGNPCTTDACDGSGSVCTHTPASASCDDGNACTLADACTGTTCAGASVTCDDGSPCTGDVCDPGSGSCVFSPQVGSCSDGSLCTSGDVCGNVGSGWGCTSGSVITCDDANPCTDDSCDPASGCVWLPNSATVSCYEGTSASAGIGLCHAGFRTCSGGTLGDFCASQVLPVSPEPCNGQDDSCNGVTDEGCEPATVALSFAAAQTSGSSGALTVKLLLAPDRPGMNLQNQQVPHQIQLGVLAWLNRLLGN